jgi:two-component system, OmpR family, response regulator
MLTGNADRGHRRAGDDRLMTTLNAPFPANNGKVDLRRADGQPVRVLVVDDEATLTELLSMALRYEGWQVQSAGDGLSAVRAAREFRPDAVVLDMMLPDMDGLEVLRRLRSRLRTYPCCS